MPNRYHLHVICTAHDQPLVLDSLAIFFQKKAFLTYDVASQLPNAVVYGRQSIDACDFAVMVIGECYGSAASVVVSQMHLSYLNAKVKLKPLFILIKTHLKPESLSWQLADLIRMVEQQANYIYYYDDNTNIEQLLSYAYSEMLQKYPLQAEWVQHKWLTSDAKYSSSQKVLAQNSSWQPQLLSDKLTNMATDNLTTAIDLNSTVKVRYSAQAYEGGNLTDVMMSTEIAWQQILSALAKIPAAFSSYGLQSCLNHLIADKAENEIKSIMPNVHAVSRYKISQDDLLCLQTSLVAANWIQIVTSATAIAPELWKLTFYAKNLFKEQQ